MAQDSFEIIPFSPALQPYFESINKAWVSQYFSLEPFDLAQLEETIKMGFKEGFTIAMEGLDTIFAEKSK